METKKSKVTGKVLAMAVFLVILIVLTAQSVLSFISYQEMGSSYPFYEIYSRHYYLPIIFALIFSFIISKYVKPWEHLQIEGQAVVGSKGFLFVLLLMLSYGMLPQLNRLYALKEYPFQDVPIVGEDRDFATRTRNDGLDEELITYYLVAQNPFRMKRVLHYTIEQMLEEHSEISGDIRLKVGRKSFEACKKQQCSATFTVKHGLLDVFYINDVKIK